MRLDHAAIRVGDAERALAWYMGVAGLVGNGREPGRIHLGCGERTVLTLVAGGAGLDHFAYEVADGAELASAGRRLDQAGVSVSGVAHDPEPGVGAALEACLHSGHRLHLVVAEPKPAYVLPSDRPASAAGAPLGLDHVNLSARDPAALADLLGLHLGFKLSDVHRVDGRTAGVWLRQGERHHDLAALAHRRDALHHVAFTMPSAAAMLAFADRLVAHGQRAEYGIGRHGPGANLFLYVHDPDGNRVEVTAEMALVPDTAPTRCWEGRDPHIIDVWAPYAPPKTFWEVT